MDFLHCGIAISSLYRIALLDIILSECMVFGDQRMWKLALSMSMGLVITGGDRRCGMRLCTLFRRGG